MLDEVAILQRIPKTTDPLGTRRKLNVHKTDQYVQFTPFVQGDALIKFFEALENDTQNILPGIAKWQESSFFLLKSFMKVWVRMDQEIKLSCQLGGQWGVFRKGTLEVFYKDELTQDVLWSSCTHMRRYVRSFYVLCPGGQFFEQFRPKACNFIKKENQAQTFSCEFCKISKNIFLTEHHWWLLLKIASTKFAISLIRINW